MNLTISLKDIGTWEDGVSIGSDLKGDLDNMHLNLGALANHLCPNRKAGRKAKAEDGEEGVDRSSSSLAREIAVDRTWLSHAANNASFYEGHYEEIPPTATLTMLSNARKASGWKTGKPATVKQIRLAIKYLEIGVDEAAASIPPSAIARVRSARTQLGKALEHETPLRSKDKALVEGAKDTLDVVDSHYDKDA